MSSLSTTSSRYDCVLRSIHLFLAANFSNVKVYNLIFTFSERLDRRWMETEEIIGDTTPVSKEEIDVYDIY